MILSISYLSSDWSVALVESYAHKINIFDCEMYLSDVHLCTKDLNTHSTVLRINTVGGFKPLNCCVLDLGRNSVEFICLFKSVPLSIIIGTPRL